MQAATVSCSAGTRVGAAVHWRCVGLPNTRFHGVSASPTAPKRQRISLVHRSSSEQSMGLEKHFPDEGSHESTASVEREALPGDLPGSKLGRAAVLLRFNNTPQRSLVHALPSSHTTGVPMQAPLASHVSSSAQTSGAVPGQLQRWQNSRVWMPVQRGMRLLASPHSPWLLSAEASPPQQHSLVHRLLSVHNVPAGALG